MSKRRFFSLPIAFIAAALVCATLPFTTSQAQQPPNDVPIDDNDIGGTVTGATGPEAGVWVIAETRDLSVRYIKSVVTDDRGRFVVPDLPPANYSVWARGYGLVDSGKMIARPGQRITIAATPAPNEAAAAHYYPAIYWSSMLKIPAADQFGDKGRIPARLNQAAWLSAVKNNGCVGCHQLGQLSTRTVPAALGTFASPVEAWRRRVQSGQAGQMMLGQLTGLGEVSFENYGDWIDRIAKGELPFAKPPRPEGIERNIVVTLRDWMNEKQYLHDLISSDRRQPTVNAYGPLFGSPEYSSDLIPILDPVKNVATTFKAPVRDPDMPLSLGPGHAAALDPLLPRPIGAPSESGTPASTITTRCSTGREGSGSPRRCVRPRTLPSVNRDPIIRQPKRSRWIVPSGTWRYTNRRPRSTRSSIRATPRIIRSSGTTPTTRCGRAAAVQLWDGSTRRHSSRPVMPPRRRVGRRWCWTRTATASATPTSSRAMRPTHRRTAASTRRSTR